MKTIISIALLFLGSTICFGQVVKYKSLNYDIEKPNVPGYQTIYQVTYHTINHYKKYILLEYTDSQGKRISKNYPFKVVSTDNMYFRFTINSLGLKSIYFPKEGSGKYTSIEYEFQSGIKFEFYSFTQIK